MTTDKSDIARRTVLQTAALAAIGQIIAAPSTASAAAPTQAAIGKPGDFNFLAGEWRIKHRRLKNESTGEWDVFEGEATCWTVLEGVASIEELRIPARNFSGMGIRICDVEKHVWADFWINSRSGVLTPPGLMGTFQNGVGTFIADDMDGDKPIKVRGVWDRIVPGKSHRWYQAVSRDGGKTWAENWSMDWLRA
jgi:hypothetical protein